MGAFSSATELFRGRHESEIVDWGEDGAEAHVIEDALGSDIDSDRWQPFLGHQNHEHNVIMRTGFTGLYNKSF